MKKNINLDGLTLDFLIKKTRLSKSIRIIISKKNGLVVTMPKYAAIKHAIFFLEDQKAWILNHIDTIKATEKNKKVSLIEYNQKKASALKLATDRLKHFNEYYKFDYNKISIRNQKSRWGSCSSKKTLSFSYRIVNLSPELCDYLIVHELCHLKEMNHSQRFYDLISETIPNHKILQKKLKHLE